MGGFVPDPPKAAGIDMGGFVPDGGSRQYAPPQAKAAPAARPAAKPPAQAKPKPTPPSYQRPGYATIKPAPSDIKREIAGPRQALGGDLKALLEAGNDPLGAAGKLAYDAADEGFSALSGAAQEGLRHVPGFRGNSDVRQARRKQYGDLASMLAPVPGAEEAKAVGKVLKPVTGAVVDGFKVLTRDPAADERAAKAVKAMTGRKPQTTPPGKPYVAGSYNDQPVMATPAGTPTNRPTQELFEAMDAEIKRLAPTAKNRPLQEPARGGGMTMAGFQTRDVRNKSLIAWAADRTNVHPDFRDQAKTVRHEAIHSLRDDGFFHPSEWAALEKQAKTENWMDRHNIHDRYAGSTDEAKLEEAIAEEFARWRAAKDTPAALKGFSAHVVRAFQRLDELLTSINGHVRRLFGQDATPDYIFQQIDRGKVGRRDLSGLTDAEIQARRRSTKRTGPAPRPKIDAQSAGPDDMGGFVPANDDARPLSRAEKLRDTGYLVFDTRKGGATHGVFPTTEAAEKYIGQHPEGRYFDYATPRQMESLNPTGPESDEYTDYMLKKRIGAAFDEDQVRPAGVSSAKPTDNVIGVEKDPVERVDNALFRLGNHDSASKIEAKQYLDDLPDDLKDPVIQERLTHALEERLKNPGAPIPPDLQEAYDAYKPWADRQRAAINEIRQIKQRAGMPIDYDEDVGYVPRYRVGYSKGLDDGGLMLPGDRQRSVLAGRNSLRSRSKSELNRQFHVVTDADGRESFVEGPVESTDPLGRPYANVRQATIQEIERATAGRGKKDGGPVEYHKNALVNTMTRALDDEKTLRNLKVLEELKSTLKAKGLAYQHYWHDPQGIPRTHPKGVAGIPDGFVEMKHIPQLEGWYMDPKVAEAFHDYHPLPGEPEADVIQKINRLATASLFATPFPHSINIGVMWTIGRGWDWMSPGAYPRMMKAGAKALNEVLTLGPEYRRMLREGSALRAADDATRNFHEAMLRAAGHQIETDPRTFKALAKAFGTGQMTPADVVRTIYAASHRMIWTVNDLALLQRQFELEARGMKTRNAIKEAETWIANYRVPPQVMKSRAMSRMLTNNHFVVFGRYEYGKWRALGEMAKPFLGKATGAERLDRLGKIIALGVLMAGAYPLMDQMLKSATGNEDAQVRRGGEAAILDAGIEFAKGEKDFASAMGSMIQPTPIVQAAVEIPNNRYSFTGQPIIEPESSFAGKTAQAIEGASQYVMPLSSGLQALQPGGLEQSLGALAGLKLPAKDRATGQAKRKRYQTQEARRRERRDPLTQNLKDIIP